MSLIRNLQDIRKPRIVSEVWTLARLRKGVSNRIYCSNRCFLISFVEVVHASLNAMAVSRKPDQPEKDYKSESGEPLPQRRVRFTEVELQKQIIQSTERLENGPVHLGSKFHCLTENRESRRRQSYAFRRRLEFATMPIVRKFRRSNFCLGSWKKNEWRKAGQVPSQLISSTGNTMEFGNRIVGLDLYSEVVIFAKKCSVLKRPQFLYFVIVALC